MLNYSFALYMLDITQALVTLGRYLPALTKEYNLSYWYHEDLADWVINNALCEVFLNMHGVKIQQHYGQDLYKTVYHTPCNGNMTIGNVVEAELALSVKALRISFLPNEVIKVSRFGKDIIIGRSNGQII